MTEPSNRHLRWTVLTVIVLVLGLLATLHTFVQRSDSAFDEATHRLQPGMTRAEVQEILKGLHYANVPLKGHTDFQFYGNCEWVTIKMRNDHLEMVEHEPDVASRAAVRRNWNRRLHFLFPRGE